MAPPRIELAIALLVLGAGCAELYRPPANDAAPEPIVEHLAAFDDDADASISRDRILAVASRVLIVDGYQITNIDKSSGTISTAPRRMRLTPEDADCGTVAGLDYLKDKRTVTTVSFGLIAYESNRLLIRAEIAGSYLQGNAIEGVALTCVSRGKLEAALMEKISYELHGTP